MSIAIELFGDELANALPGVSVPKIVDVMTDKDVNDALGTDYENVEHPYIIDLTWRGGGYWLLFRGHRPDGNFDVWVVEIDKDLTPDFSTAKKLYDGLSVVGPAPCPFVKPADDAIYMILTPSQGYYRVDKFDYDFTLLSTGSDTALPDSDWCVAGFAPVNENLHYMTSIPVSGRNHLKIHRLDDTFAIQATWDPIRLRSAFVLEHTYIYYGGMWLYGIHELQFKPDGLIGNRFFPHVSWTFIMSSGSNFKSVLAPLFLPVKNWMPACWIHPGIHFTNRPWFMWTETAKWDWGRGASRIRAVPVSLSIFDPSNYDIFHLAIDNDSASSTSLEYRVVLPCDVRILELEVVLRDTGNVSVTGGSEGETETAETLYSATGVSGAQYIKYENPPRFIKIAISYSAANTAYVTGWARRGV
ncbi:MAG: hypothetical protein DRH17_12875 [Deltaproteobacteria bacterium]|nr:MAG: hypothetical protein DRH17_12875 [Deltaproteobacteria bacterium]